MPAIKSSNFNQRALAERMAMNTPIQGTAADIIKIAMNRASEAIKEANLKSRILLQVHDELVLEVVKEEIEKVSEILTTAMQNIQIEFGDIGNILAYLSIGDRPQELERLVSALAEIRRRYQTDSSGLMNQEYIDPEVVMSPQEAFYAETISVPIGSSAGCICSEFVMCYPPGIPILAPGEKITEDILEYIKYAKEKGCSMTGPEDPEIEYINILKEDDHGTLV